MRDSEISVVGYDVLDSTISTATIIGENRVDWLKLKSSPVGSWSGSGSGSGSGTPTTVEDNIAPPSPQHGASEAEFLSSLATIPHILIIQPLASKRPCRWWRCWPLLIRRPSSVPYPVSVTISAPESHHRRPLFYFWLPGTYLWFLRDPRMDLLTPQTGIWRRRTRPFLLLLVLWSRRGISSRISSSSSTTTMRFVMVPWWRHKRSSSRTRDGLGEPGIRGSLGRMEEQIGTPSYMPVSLSFLLDLLQDCTSIWSPK